MKKNLTLIVISLTYLISFQLIYANVTRKINHPSEVKSSPIDAKKWKADVEKIFEHRGTCLRPPALYQKLKKILESSESPLINLTNILPHKNTGKPVLPPKHNIGLDKDIESLQAFMNPATGHKYILSAPANDINPIDNASKIKSSKGGNYPIDKALADIKNYVGSIDLRKYTALVPMTLSWRKHWILLQITKSNTYSKHVKITLIDSKGLQASIVPTKYIQKALKRYFPESDIRHIYLGHQGVLNNVDCGFYAISYTLYLLYGFPTKGLGKINFNKLV